MTVSLCTFTIYTTLRGRRLRRKGGATGEGRATEKGGKGEREGKRVSIEKGDEKGETEGDLKKKGVGRRKRKIRERWIK